MNVILISRELWSDEKAHYRYWVAEYEKIRADRAFGRARRRTLLRRLGRLPGIERRLSGAAFDGAAIEKAATAPSGSGLADGTTVPIESIVGAGDRGVFGPLPVLKRRWKEIWRRAWAEDDIDALGALPVVRGPGGWYLTEPARSASVLEVLRAKGVREVRIRHEAVAAPHVEAEDVGTTSVYRLVDCERSYDCRDVEDQRQHA